MHYPAVGPIRRRVGVVLCQPILWEYQAFYPAFTRLARTLSENGIDVFQFDYFGCGDSEGDIDQGTLEIWLTDVADAVAELRCASGNERTCLIGCRLGGYLALTTALGGGEIDGLVLWNPIISGKKYLRQLHMLDQMLLNMALTEPVAHTVDTENTITGYSIGQELMSELKAIAVPAGQLPEIRNVLLVENETYHTISRLNQHLDNMGVKYDYKEFSSNEAGGKWSGVSGYMPDKLLDFIAGWVVEAYY